MKESDSSEDSDESMPIVNNKTELHERNEAEKAINLQLMLGTEQTITPTSPLNPVFKDSQLNTPDSP